MFEEMTYIVAQDEEWNNLLYFQYTDVFPDADASSGSKLRHHTVNARNFLGIL